MFSPIYFYSTAHFFQRCQGIANRSLWILSNTILIQCLLDSPVRTNCRFCSIYSSIFSVGHGGAGTNTDNGGNSGSNTDDDDDDEGGFGGGF